MSVHERSTQRPEFGVAADGSIRGEAAWLIDDALAKLDDARPGRATQAALSRLTGLAEEPSARDALLTRERLDQLLDRLRREPTPSFDEADLGQALRGGSGRAARAGLAAFGAADDLLVALGEPAAGALEDVLDGPVCSVGRVWLLGAQEPAIYGLKLSAMTAIERLGAGDAAIWRRVALRGAEEPWVVIEAARRWGRQAPTAAASAVVERFDDYGFGPAGEARYHARRLRSLGPWLGQAVALHVLQSVHPLSRRLELLAMETADPGWLDSLHAALGRVRSPQAAQALHRLWSLVDRSQPGWTDGEAGWSTAPFGAEARESSAAVGPRRAALVLAAGRGERLGGGKLALPWGRTTILGRVLERLRAADIELCHVVVGHEPERLLPIIEAHGAVAVPNPDFADGMLSSVQAGLRSLPPVDAVVLQPGDLPLVATRTLRGLLAAWSDADGMLIPTYLYQSGHPILLAGSLFDEVERLDPEVGLRQLRDRVPDRIRYVAVDDPAILLDIDTPGDYRLHRPKDTPPSGVTESQHPLP